jgi:hypothetical protein
MQLHVKVKDDNQKNKIKSNFTPPPHHTYKTIKMLELFGPGKIYTHILYQKVLKSRREKIKWNTQIFSPHFG